LYINVITLFYVQSSKEIITITSWDGFVAWRFTLLWTNY